MLSEYYSTDSKNLEHMFMLNYSNINLEKFEKMYSPVMEDHIYRTGPGWVVQWSKPVTSNFSKEIIKIKDFIQQRERYIYQFISNDLSLSGKTADIKISTNDIQGGSVQINTITPDLTNGWTGTYLTDYPVTITRDEYPHIVAKTFHGDASIEVSYSVSENGEQVFAFNVESEDKTKVTTSVRMTTPKETSTALGGIFFNGVAMRENGEGYTSSSVYDPEIKEYNIKLHSASPKMEQPTMPNITAKAGAYGQNVVIENGGIDGDTYITVTAESGAETTYALKFKPELSSNVRLNDLLLNYETIKDFQPKRYFYQIKLQKGVDMPEVSWQAADAFQTVEVKEYADRIDVVVTAEDGTSEIYQIGMYQM